VTAAYRRDWLAWFLVGGILISLIGPIALLTELGQPFGGYVTFQRAGREWAEVDGNTPSWWSGLTFRRLNHGDSLVSIDGRPHQEAARATYAAAIDLTPAIATVEAGRGGDTRPVTVPVDPFNFLDFMDLRLPDLITSTVLWLAAVVVYRSRPSEPANRAFAIASATAGFGRLLYVHTLFFDTTTAVITELLLQVWLVVLGPALLLLALRYPTRTANRAAWLLFGLVAAAAGIAILSTVYSRLGFVPLERQATAERLGYILTILLFFLGLLAVFVRLVRWLLTVGESRRNRRIAVVLIVGWGLALPAFIASGINAFNPEAATSFYFFRGLDLRYAMLFAPLAFAFVLVRYQALQAPPPLFIFLMVFTTSALAAALAAWAWTLTHQDWPENSLQPPFLSLFLTALSIGVFWTTFASLPRMLGRTLAWDRYSSATARQFGRRVSDTMNVSRTPAVIVQAMVEEFELAKCALWLADDDGAALRLAAQGGEDAADMPVLVPLAGRTLATISEPFRPVDVVDPAQPWAAGAPESQGVEVAVPLAVDGRLLGVLGVGRRWDEDVFDTRNLQLLEIVGQQVSWLLAVTAHIEALERVPGRLADVQERERLRLAQELHDTTQQFLGRLPFYLAISRDSMGTDPARATALLDQALDEVEDAAQTLRQIRLNMAPTQLERGLAQPLVTLTTSFQRRTGLETALVMPPELDEVTTLETRVALYRVVQQALDNIDAHAAASRVTVRLVLQEGLIYLTVQDDGRGADEAERQAAHAQGSFGIETMKARLTASGGGLEIHSAPKEGLEVRGWVPVAAPPALAGDNGSAGPQPIAPPAPQNAASATG
jgi:signal transduction histidine kinase